MNKNTIFWILTAGAVTLLLLMLDTTISNHFLSRDAAAEETNFSYLPVVLSPKIYPVPQVSGTITLSGALCPNDAAYNAKDDLWYVLNTGSSDVSIVRNEQWAGNVWVGGRPTAVDVNQTTGYAYVTNLPEPAPPASVLPNANGLRPCGDPNGAGRDPACISVFDGSNRLVQYDARYEPFAVKIHPATGIAYATDLDSVAYLLDGSNLTAEVRLETAGDGISGWPLSIVHDPVTNLTYIMSWELGNIYVMDQTVVTDSFSYRGWGGYDIALDVKNGYFYIANSETDVDGRPTNNISILQRGSQTATPVWTAAYSQYVAVNQTTGFAYVTNPADQTVTILQNGAVVKTVSVQKDWTDFAEPFDVEVNQESGYAFVTLTNVNEVLVFQDADIVARLPAGRRPFAVGTDNVNGITYIINRNSKTSYDDLQRPYEECLLDPTITILR